MPVRNTDLSGTPLPPDSAATASGTERTIAVPPIVSAPNEQALEVLVSAYTTLIAGQVFGPVNTHSDGSNAFAGFPLDQNTQAKISAITVFVPDFTAIGQIVNFQVLINNAPAPGWGSVPVYGRAGIASVSFDSNILIPPGSSLVVKAANLDATNNHFFAIYLQGWSWARNLAQA